MSECQRTDRGSTQLGRHLAQAPELFLLTYGSAQMHLIGPAMLSGDTEMRKWPLNMGSPLSALARLRKPEQPSLTPA